MATKLNSQGLLLDSLLQNADINDFDPDSLVQSHAALQELIRRDYGKAHRFFSQFNGLTGFRRAGIGIKEGFDASTYAEVMKRKGYIDDAHTGKFEEIFQDYCDAHPDIHPALIFEAILNSTGSNDSSWKDFWRRNTDWADHGATMLDQKVESRIKFLQTPNNDGVTGQQYFLDAMGQYLNTQERLDNLANDQEAVRNAYSQYLETKNYYLNGFGSEDNLPDYAKRNLALAQRNFDTARMTYAAHAQSIANNSKSYNDDLMAAQASNNQGTDTIQQSKQGKNTSSDSTSNSSDKSASRYPRYNRSATIKRLNNLMDETSRDVDPEYRQEYENLRNNTNKLSQLRGEPSLTEQYLSPRQSDVTGLGGLGAFANAYKNKQQSLKDTLQNSGVSRLNQLQDRLNAANRDIPTIANYAEDGYMQPENVQARQQRYAKSLRDALIAANRGDLDPETQRQLIERGYMHIPAY